MRPTPHRRSTGRETVRSTGRSVLERIVSVEEGQGQIHTDTVRSYSDGGKPCPARRLCALAVGATAAGAAVARVCDDGLLPFSATPGGPCLADTG